MRQNRVWYKLGLGLECGKYRKIVPGTEIDALIFNSSPELWAYNYMAAERMRVWQYWSMNDLELPSTVGQCMCHLCSMI